MTLDEITKEVKSGQFKPIYLFYGDEAFFTDKYEQIVTAHALQEAERSFNETILYGQDIDAPALLDNVRRFPMMAARQLVVVREAQEMKQFEALAPYFEKPVPTTILVLCFKNKKPDMRTRAGKALKINGLCIESKKLYDNQIPDWVMSEGKRQGLNLSPQVAQMMAEYVGADLNLLSNQMEKLTINLPKGTQVTTQHIETHIGVSKEYSVFDLQKALGERNRGKVIQIVQSFAANTKKNPFIPVVSSLYAYFSKVWLLQAVINKSESEQLAALQLKSAYFLKDYRATARQYTPAQVRNTLGLLKEYDLKSKGVECNTDEEELLKELTMRILL